MIENVRRRLAASRETVAAVFANRDLRRLELGRIAATVSASGTAVVYVLLAYRAGGAEAVAALIVVTTWTAAFAYPIVSPIADRFARRRVIVGADVVRIALLATTALAAVDGPVWLVILLSSAVTVVGTASSSARAALVPELARDSSQLVGANALAAMTSSAASLLGPAIAGVAVALQGPAAALVALALSSIASAVAALRIEHDDVRERTARKRWFGAQAFGGFRALIASRGVRVVVLLTAAQTFVGGVLAVLLVLAVIETLGFGETGPSYLAGALSAGTLLGSVALLLVGERRLGAGMAVGLGMWGLAAAAVGLAPSAFIGVALIALIGLGDSLADLSALTIVQRLVPNDVLARALGALRGLFYTLASIGSLVAPIVVDVLGVRAGLVISGLAVPILAFTLFPLLADAAAAPAAPARELLRTVPLFATLSPAALERLATTASRVDVGDGEVIVREGDDDRGFYVVAAGEVEVDVGGRVVAKEGVGGYFGEIASLRDARRTATVRASAPSELLFVPGDEFLEALSGDEEGYGAAERVIATRLARAV